MKTERAPIYEIKVQGKLNQQWSDWLSGVTICHVPIGEEILITTLTGPIVDQAALRGILNQLWDLNLTLLSVTLLDTQHISNPCSSALARVPLPVEKTQTARHHHE